MTRPVTALSALVTSGAALQALIRDGHHQAVGEVAPDRTVTARGVDGVVEAVEHRDPCCRVVGVQWHPEDSDGPAHQSICRTG